MACDLQLNNKAKKGKMNWMRSSKACGLVKLGD